MRVEALALAVVLFAFVPLAPQGGAYVSAAADTYSFNVGSGPPSLYWVRSPVYGGDILAYCLEACSHTRPLHQHAQPPGTEHSVAVGVIPVGSTLDGFWDLAVVLGGSGSVGYSSVVRTAGGLTVTGQSGCFITAGAGLTEARSSSVAYGVVDCPATFDGGFLTHPYANLPNVISFSDVDADTYAADAEVGAGSSPVRSASRPSTDDDGDGTANSVEPAGGQLGDRAACTGAYGVLAFSTCGGYVAPVGGTCGSAFAGACVDGAAPQRVWAWDPVCVPGAQGAYASCKLTASNYAGSPTPYTGTFTGDGYGWRMLTTVPVVGPVTVEVPEICTGYPVDADADQVPKVLVCKRSYVVSTSGTVTSSGAQTVIAGPVGDPDDANNQVPVPSNLIQDPDADGSPSSVEVDSGSSPALAASRPSTDDDGDATLNNAEPVFVSGVVASRALCTGAYGVVASDACLGYAAPATTGCVGSPSGLWVCQNSAVHVWDSVCTDTYASCAASSQRVQPAPVYGGTFSGDGYGWRRLAWPITSQNVTVARVCDVPTADADADGVPVVRRCQRWLVVNPDGTFTWGPEVFVSATGDPNDGNVNDPIPNNTIASTLAQVEATKQQTVSQVLAAVNSTLVTVNGLVVTAQAAAAGAQASAGALAASVQATSASAQATALAFAASASQNATGLSSLQVCVSNAESAYVTNVGAKSNTYLASPTVANQTALQNALVFGAASMGDQVAACNAAGTAATVSKAVVAAGVSAFRSYASSLNATIAAGQQTVAVVSGLIGPSGAALNNTLAVALGSGSFAIQTVTVYVLSVQSLANQLLDAVAKFDYAALAGGIVSKQSAPASGGRSTLRFFVHDSGRRLVANASVRVFDGDVVVFNQTTGPSGSVSGGFSAGKAYRLEVVHPKYLPYVASVVAPSEGSDMEVDVALDARLIPANVPTNVLFLVGGGLVVAVLGLVVGRRMRA